MKYFTLEELNEISRELLENPSRETLKKLSDKYNSEVEKENIGGYSSTNWVEVKNEETPSAVSTNKVEMQNLTPNIPMPQFESTPEINNNQPYDNQVLNNGIWEQTNSIPNINNQASPTIFKSNADMNIPTLDIQPIDAKQPEPIFNTEIQTSTQGTVTNQMNLPYLETPTIQNNSNSIPFNGNLWEPQNNGLNNMMQTTDNFNAPIETAPNTEIPVNTNFFQGIPNQINNSIPVVEPPRPEGPTMFGQLEQNINNNAA